MSPADLLKQENRRKAVEVVVERCIEWYVQVNGGVGPTELREYAHPNGEVIYRWFEPPIPNEENPVVVEAYFRGFWTVAIEPRSSIKVPS